MTLTGSHKQIAWAEQIRAQKFEELDDMLATTRRRMEESGTAPALIAERLESIAPFVARIRATTDASWWIDHRYSLMSDVIKEMYKEATQE